MSVAQVRRMDDIEIWRQKAFLLSRTDRLGRLITKTFDLILTVIRDGPNAEILLFEAESLKIEQANEMKFDNNRDDIYRSLFYGLSASLGSMIESIQERKEESSETAENPKQVVVQMTQDKQNTAYLNNADEEDNQYFLPGTAKVEPMESRDNLALDAVDFNLEDLKSELLTDHNEIDNFPVDSTSDEFADILDSSNANNNADGAADESKDARDEIDQPTSKRARFSISHENNEAIVQKSVAVISVATTPMAAGNFDCDNCEKKFDTPKALLRHSRIHNGFKCGECGNVLKNREKLIQHYAEFHPGKKVKEAESSARKSLQCAHCDHKANCPANLTVHMYTHTGEKPYACSQCPKKFAQTSNLYVHMRTCHAENTHDKKHSRKRKDEKTGGPKNDLI